MANTEDVENLHVSENIQDVDLSHKNNQHAKKFGTEYAYGDVKEITVDGDYKIVKAGDNSYKTKTVIIATGAIYRKLGKPGEEELTGRGVSYCAVCDGAFFRDREIVVIG